MKWLKRIILVILTLMFLALSSAMFITWKYEEDLKEFALETVRSTIETNVHFNKEVRLSLWKDFPLVSVELSDIQIEDDFQSDTLLNVEKAFVQFDILKLLRNDIQIRGIRVTNGFLKLKRTVDDKWNYKVWKTPNRQDPNTKTNFSIEILTLENVHLDYDDRAVDLNIQFLSIKSKLQGRFEDKSTRLGLSINGFMENLSTIGDDRIVDLPMELAGILNIDSENKIYAIETGNAVLAGNEVVLEAEWKKLDSGTDMQMKVHAGNIEPGVLLKYVWPQIPESIRNLSLEGRSDIVLNLNGPFKLNSGPTLDAVIRMRDGGLTFQQTKVSDLSFEGKVFMQDIKQSKAMEIKFDRFSLSTPKGQVSGTGKLTNLSNPYLKIKTKGNSRLEELIAVANIKETITAFGGVSWNIDFSGPLGKDFNTTVNELKGMTWSGNLTLSDAKLKFNSGIPELTSLHANISMNGGKTSITQCSGKIGHLNFDGNMDVYQLKRIMTDANSRIALNGNVQIKKLDIEKLPAEWQFESDRSTVNGRAININVTTQIDEVQYKNFTATNVIGDVSLSNNRVDIDQLRLNALGGKISSSLAYFPNPSGYMLHLDGSLSNIDISRTLSEWNDFGQETIGSENLKGKASATLEADIQLSEDQTLLKDQLRVESSVEVSGGQLLKFEPLLAMSRFIDVDELNNVEFDTLRNQLSIRNSKLYIPRMSVSSSILNVEVYGEHGFDQEMDYHVNLLLNDLIRRKAKRKRTFDGHEIIDEKGKTRLFLWIRGTPENIKVGYDRKEVRQKIKSDLKSEGQTIKQLFKEEFGGKSAETEPNEENIQFKLDDDGLGDEPNVESESTESTQKKKKKKKRGLFSNDPEEQETEGGFEIEFEP